jgi:hypothetical protein
MTSQYHVEQEMSYTTWEESCKTSVNAGDEPTTQTSTHQGLERGTARGDSHWCGPDSTSAERTRGHEPADADASCLPVALEQ